MKQISQNYISISSILIDEKITSMNAKYKNVQNDMNQSAEKQSSDLNKNESSKEKGSRKISKRKASMRKSSQEVKMTENEVK